MPFWIRLILSFIFFCPVMILSGAILSGLLARLFRLIPLGSSRRPAEYILWAIFFLITFILGCAFLLSKKHTWASGMFLVSSGCLGPLIPYFGNFLAPFSGSFRNIQFWFWIASSLYFCNVMLSQYQLVGIGIGVIFLLLFVLYMIIRGVVARRLMKSCEEQYQEYSSS